MTKKTKDLSIITVSTNEGALLKDCLESIRGHQTSAELEVIIIDNYSHDNTSQIVEAHYPHAILHRTIAKLGFSSNNNWGIKRSSGRYVLLLNPDTILHEGVLDGMIAYMDDNPEVGASACKLLNPDGSLQHTCRRFPKPLALVQRWLSKYLPLEKSQVLNEYLMLEWDHAQTREVDWILGAFMLLRRSALEQVGLLDTAFDPLYYEDTDFCARLWQAGYKVTYNPHYSITHIYDRESARGINRMTYYHARNIYHFFKKHGQWLRRHRAG